MNRNISHLMSSWYKESNQERTKHTAFMQEPTKNWQLHWVSIIIAFLEREREVLLLKCRSSSIGQISQIWRLKTF